MEQDVLQSIFGNGFEFETIGSASIDGPFDSGYQFIDIDDNGIEELVLRGDIAGSARPRGWIPQRIKTVIYPWNGYSFEESRFEYVKPEYRFQAIQDADLAVTFGDYEKAILLYQEAIFSGELDWWSAEKQAYLDDIYFSQATLTVFPTPNPDTNEYPRLAAYAYYRMVALHIYLGQMDAAQTKFDTMMQKFPQGNPGYPYVELATAFWDAYQSTQDMTSACAAAINYAAKTPTSWCRSAATITAHNQGFMNQDMSVRSGSDRGA